MATLPLWLAGSLLLLILYIRVTRGIDFSDEMQYYGQIRGLIDTGRLFSNDLFIQQTVYLLFYPVFWGYHSLFGYEAFIFFGRSLLAAICIFTSIFIYRKLRQWHCKASSAALVSLATIFAIPYHGDFSINYNTISQTLWIVFLIQFYDWNPKRAIFWSSIIALTAFAHQTSALMMAALVVLRLWKEANHQCALRIFIFSCVTGVLGILVLISFATLNQYMSAILFSSGYGVGDVFFSKKIDQITLLFMYTMFVIAYIKFGTFTKYFPEKFSQEIESRKSQILLIFLLLACLSFFIHWTQGGYSYRTVVVLSVVSALSYSFARRNPNIPCTKDRNNVDWFVFAMLSVATVLGITSGNGIGQATGGLMIGLPLLIVIAFGEATLPRSKGKLADGLCLIVLILLFIIHWCQFPYRESFWWTANQYINSSPAFKYIYTSKERNNIINDLFSRFDRITDSKRTLIIGDLPILYTMTNMKAETCMLFMHGLSSLDSSRELLKCFRDRRPEIIIIVSTSRDNGRDDLFLKKIMAEVLKELGFQCESDDVIMNYKVTLNINPNWIKYRLCLG